jgi:hypothetical protein
MELDKVGAGVESLLRELHEKKEWLDTMIEGLEAALDSPEHRLIELAEQTFEASRREAPRVDLELDGKSALATLARRVGATPQARRKRSRGGHQAVST